jgi:hypothetical protein
VLSQLGEGSSDVDIGLGGTFDVLAAESLSEVLSGFSGDLTERRIGGNEVELVADEKEAHSLVAVLVSDLDPVANVVERFSVVKSEDEHGRVNSAEEGGDDGLEAILASGVPQLELDDFSLAIKDDCLEVDTDCGDERRRVLVVGEAPSEAGFADAGISNDDALNKKITFTCILASVILDHAHSVSEIESRSRSDIVGRNIDSVGHFLYFFVKKKLRKIRFVKITLFIKRDHFICFFLKNEQRISHDKYQYTTSITTRNKKFFKKIKIEL